MVALVLLTGVSLRSAARGVGTAGRWAFEARPGRARGPGVAVRRRSTPPTRSAGRWPGPVEVVPPPEPGPDPTMGPVPEVALPVTAVTEPGPVPEAGPPDPVALPEEATRPGTGSQLEMKLGPSVGEWRLPPANLPQAA